MKRQIVLVLACVAVLAPGRAFAQGPQLRLDQFDALSSRAKEAVNVSLDQSMMQMATAFISGAAKNNGASGKNISDIVAGLKGVYVRNFSFDAEGSYTPKDIDSVRAQLKSPWTSIVSTREEHETVEVYTWPENGQIGGLAVLVVEPKEVTIVNIVGKIDMSQLASLAGSFGIPKTLGITLPVAPKTQNKDE
ncbi:MAG TPA: DUF4252 domain-containing protein [Vicinamibacterales bacterium]|jgi:hypothetical protein|nr:DUF4252 domain-containing protein [Vicinamibacterales bacterium]